ncbi:MAG TPA: MFS transporter [Phycicoccus sp.]|nr:MFS transporter [Phycicoccus sp.]HQK30854.1 MFS transporter [Phycicoccus sp.]HRA43986.1 MFS transporter [Phycicoccus sp.]
MSTTTAPPTRALTTHRGAIAAAFLVQGLLFISLTTRLPVLAEMFTLDELALSGLMLMMVLLAGVGSVAAEAVAKRASSAAALRVGLVLLGLGTLIMGFSVREPGTFAVFVTGLAIYGTGVGAVDASANMQAVTLEHQIGRPVLPSLHGAWTLGGIIATLIALTTADAVGWIGALALALLPLLAVAAPYFRRDAGVPDADTTKLGIPWRPIMLIGIGLVVFYTVDTATTAWGPLYLASSTVFAEPASSASLYALATLPYLVATLLARIVGDAATARFGAPTMIRVGAIVGFLGLAIVVFSPTWVVAIVGFFVVGLGMAVVAPLSFSAAAALAGDVDPALRQRRVDAVIARFNQFNYVGALIGSVLTGAIGSGNLRIGYAVPMVLVLALVPLAKAFAGKIR